MKNIRLIEIKKLEMTIYSVSEEKEIVKLLPDLNFSKNRDLKFNSQSAGIAFRISFLNNQSLFSKPRGFRRPVTMVITDRVTHEDVVVKDFNLNVSKNDYFYVFHSCLPLKEFPFDENHDYTLNFYDCNKGAWLGEYYLWMVKSTDETDEDNDNGLSTFQSLLNDWVNPGNKKDSKSSLTVDKAQNFRDSLNSLTGLYEVKKKLSDYESLVIFNKKRSDIDLPTISTPLHAMFLGSPGTGKTTVAKMMGEMLHKRGLLSKGHVIVKERANLLGQNYNSEGENTLEAIEAAQGGILFIDEAYQLFQPQDPRDPGKFVIETLLTALSDTSKRDWMLILAGYPEEMKKMWAMNPGFKSRIPESNIYQFDDFTEPELMEIAENYFSGNRFHLTEAAHEVLAERLKFDLLNKDKSFGNARYVLNLIQTEILPSMAVRIVKEGKNSFEALCKVEAEDIPQRKPVKTRVIKERIGYVA